ncbi:MAG: serine/threonine protein kinase [Sandaracinaceae bacterium]|nr:serine/threonine protein kinase [Sandaracinaceae bacterium]
MADEAYDPGIEAAGYRLERPVARGGMGEIWLARSVATGERVALKRILFDPGGPSPENLAARLARETEVLARLEHPHVVRYIGGGRDQKGLPFLALEWLEGQSLAERLRTAPLDLATSVDIVRQALDGIGACHRAGIVHRDIKPENLFLAKSADGAERVKVLDLGIALVEARHTRLTAAGAVIGTLYYLAPEQARGAPNVDLRADLYAMGVVLYELCTGQLPSWPTLRSPCSSRSSRRRPRGRSTSIRRSRAGSTR